MTDFIRDRLQPDPAPSIPSNPEQARTYHIQAGVTSLAEQFGMLDPEAVMVLADLSNVSVSETGVVSGLGQAIQALRQSKSYLFKPYFGGIGSSGGMAVGAVQSPGSAVTNQPNHSMNAWIRSKANR